MGRRSEPRIAISFPVLVRGFDSYGSPFVAEAETDDISFSGASLKGLKSFKEAGMKVEVECRDQRAWYRIQWVGRNGASKASRIGIRCLEPDKYIWGVAPSEWEPDRYDSSKPETFASSPGFTMNARALSKKGEERRKYPRRACRIEAHLTLGDGSAGPPGTITDISLGGCYVEMLSPLPLGTDLTLSFSLGDAALQLSCKVRSAQNGFGMGVSFTGMKSEDFETLRKFAPLPAAEDNPQALNPPAVGSPDPGRRVASDAAELDSRDLPAAALEAVVRLLLRKGVLTPAELAEELEKLKTSKT
jgi:hypothetical protein